MLKINMCYCAIVVQKVTKGIQTLHVTIFDFWTTGGGAVKWTYATQIIDASFESFMKNWVQVSLQKIVFSH